ncbi:pyridoxal phosphate-dependent aminotransferase [Paroceanicella profunda]|uniref:Pyridoxal phosphate-dependent aminotransferase n=1 Tax=Paroceanicella profunda TaxID=2579971 RepID=A0A5B8FG53_9RHOB|nr:pyridoxal phosphate-dependent aminotransferase [Paroceanicella profunda]QDL90707.1 pyridoxal phosphate-dependent aminotransferase [Paroceanicella profunda]
MMTPRYTPLIDSLPASVPFVGPETQERATGRVFDARLGANESVFGPSPKAIAAMEAAARDTWMYGDPENHDLRHALAARHATRPENIVVGEGVDGLLGYLVRLVTQQGTPVVTSLGTYPTFNFHVAGYGGRLETVPYTGDATDPEALLAKTRETGAPLVYLANPDNPMAGLHAPGVITDMIANLPEGALLCLDEAYIDLAPEGSAPDIDADDPRVIRFRTFSKAHGLAGARVGYALCAPGLASAFNKVRNHFGMCRISQAGALAALGDEAWLTRVRGEVAAARSRIAAIGAANGLESLPSATNFVTLDCGRDGDFARALVRELGARGIFVRMPFVAPQDRCIRISAGTPADLDLVEARLPEALRALR